MRTQGYMYQKLYQHLLKLEIQLSTEAQQFVLLAEKQLGFGLWSGQGRIAGS